MEWQRVGFVDCWIFELMNWGPAVNGCTVALLHRHMGRSEIGKILRGRGTRVPGRDPRRNRVKDSRRGFVVGLPCRGGPDSPGRRRPRELIVWNANGVAVLKTPEWERGSRNSSRSRSRSGAAGCWQISDRHESHRKTYQGEGTRFDGGLRVGFWAGLHAPSHTRLCA